MFVKESCRLVIRKYLFSQRMINDWNSSELMRWLITWFCDTTFVYVPVSDFYALLQYSFTRSTVASGVDSNFTEYKVKHNDFEPLTASDTAESFLN